jgi:hypothetical protein
MKVESRVTTTTDHPTSGRAAVAHRVPRRRSGHDAARSQTDVAEAGVIFGLPIVINYGVVDEFIIDRTADQYKVPLNTIKNEDIVATYRDTVVVALDNAIFTDDVID